MDQRSVKRPRSATPTTGDIPQKKKNSKKNKNKKKVQMPEATSAANKTKQNVSPLDETATAEGQMMSQMLSTFSTMEQSRFEAYQRAKLNHAVIEDWVAACLSHHMSCDEVRPLSDLVSPGSHRDIGMVVATAAKIYAQRLVAAAVQKDNSPLTPEQVWKVLHERRRNGMDPGFFLEKNQGVQWIAPMHGHDYEQRRLAGLAAQEAYDEQFGTISDELEDNESGIAEVGVTWELGKDTSDEKNEMRSDDDKNDRQSDDKNETKVEGDNEVKDEDFMDDAEDQ